MEQTEGVRQEQVVQFILDPTEQTPIEPFALKSQIDVGARSGCALGPRAEKHGLPDLWVISQLVLDPLHRLLAQSVLVHDSAPCSRVNRVANCGNCAQ